jgi:hypothetical protein
MSEKIADSSQRQLVAEWIEGLAKPHKDLGREGAVCPFVGPALKQGKLIITSSDIEPTLEQMQQLLQREMVSFLRGSLECNDENELMHMSTVIALEKCSTQEHAEIMNRAHAMSKLDFMHARLMVGQFHPFNETPGLHNSAFRPFRSPGFCFSIRHMIPSDRAFATQNLLSDAANEAIGIMIVANATAHRRRAMQELILRYSKEPVATQE